MNLGVALEPHIECAVQLMNSNSSCINSYGGQFPHSSWSVQLLCTASCICCVQIQRSLSKHDTLRMAHAHVQSDDSGSESELSEGGRAARDRVAPKTQKDYSSSMRGLIKFVLERPQLFSEFIQNGEVALPVPLAIGKAYLAHCRDTMISWPLDPRPEPSRTGMKHYSTQKLDGIISAIKYSFCKLSVDIPSRDITFYSNFSAAYRQIISQAKANSEYPAEGGAVPLAMSSCIRLLIAALKAVPTGKGSKESSIRRVWLFLLLSIATCGRGERVARVQLQFISWFADCLTVQIPTSKSDQDGLMSYAKLCSANPYDPACCLVTALGVEFLSRDDTSSVRFLFGNAEEQTGYMVNQMQTALKYVLNIVGEKNLGVTFERLCGHFLKKTGISFMRSNHECISHDSRELRADHKVGPYNHRSDQDGVVGRVLAFLKPGSVEFASAPPHFHPDIVSALPWATFVPHYDQYSPGTKLAIHACVASVIHNYEFVTRNLSKSHAFHGCRLVKTHSKWVTLLQPHVLGGRSGFKSLMEQTGQSLISKICVDLELMKTGRSGHGHNEELLPELIELKVAVKKLTEVIQEQAGQAVIASPELQPNDTVPKNFIGYLSEKFPFPVGLTIQDLWRRWHCGNKPLRAIHTKMLLPSLTAAEKLRQCCMRRKMKAVMEIVQGQTEDKTVDLDPEFVWKVCWERTVSLFTIPLPCNWVVSTAYDFFLRSKELVKAARATISVHVPDVAVAAAATAAKAAQDASAFAVAAASHQRMRVRDAAGAAPVIQEEADHVSAAITASVVENIRIHTVHLGGAVVEAAAVDEDAPNRLVLSSLPQDSTALHEHWPIPSNYWTPGAVQCARCCNSCKKGQWHVSDKQIAAHFRLFHGGVPQLRRVGRDWVVEETAWCVKGFNAAGVALIGHRRDGGASWVPAQAAKRPRPTTAQLLQPEEEQAAQLAAARAYALALTQMSQNDEEKQRLTRARIDEVQRMLE